MGYIPPDGAGTTGAEVPRRHGVVHVEYFAAWPHHACLKRGLFCADGYWTAQWGDKKVAVRFRYKRSTGRLHTAVLW